MNFAVTGAAVSLPDAPDLDRMRMNLLGGTTHVRPVSDDAAARAGVGADDITHPNYVPVASVLDDATLFDHELFRMSAAEARWTDPQQRLLLSLAHDALESTGSVETVGRCGVYVTTSASTYLWGSEPEPRYNPARLDYSALLGNDRDFAASRIAYKLGLTGPAMTIQSACSSSLVALHQACLELAFGGIDAAVVGAASVAFPQEHGYIYEQGGILSPTGRSRPFDASSDGTVRGSGAGVVVVRRLDDAVRDGDSIVGVIAGTAVNNDGAQRMSYSAPSARGQQEVLEAAVSRAGIDADEIGYVEAHGTGTSIGDPIEFRALSHVYRDRGRRTAPCYLGSAKANYGHLDVAAGMIGLLKSLLTLSESTIFPQPAYSAPNPGIDLGNSVFEIADTAVSVPGLRHAALSSFGMGGTNAHVVLSRSPQRMETPIFPARPTVTLSARTAEGLLQYRDRLARYLGDRPQIQIRDIAGTLAGRTRHEYTFATTAADSAELAERLSSDRSGDADAPANHSSDDTVAGIRVWLPPMPQARARFDLPRREFGALTDTTSARSGEFDSVRATFLKLVGDELGTSVNEATDFFDAGGESIGLVTVIGNLADHVSFRIDFAELEGIGRVGEMIAVLERQESALRSAQRELLQFGSGSPDIYMYPPAGGTNFCYAALQRDMPEYTIAAFRTDRRTDSVEGAAARCLRILDERGAITENLVLGGYSFGGNVVFEVARILEQSGRPTPRRIVMIDSYAPGAFGARTSETDRVIAELGSDVQDRLVRAAMNVPTFDPAVDVDSSGTQILESFRAVWAANNRALTRYRPPTTVRTPVTILRADTPLDAMWTDTLGIDVELADDWSKWTEVPVTVVDVPGDHYSVLTDAANRAKIATAFVDAVIKSNHTESERL